MRTGFVVLALGGALGGLGCESLSVLLGESAAGVDVNVDSLGEGGYGGDAPDVVCRRTSSTTTLRPAVLGFAFDVSGSMGRLDCPFWNHDPRAKWRPVVDATTAFFEGEDTLGLRASMTLFPAAGDQCLTTSYRAPDVPLTELPSNAFREALAAYEDEVGLADYTDPMPFYGGDWRGGTPTHAVLEATHEFLAPLELTEPETRIAMVLVTDGMPAGCGDDVEHWANVIGAVSDARAGGIPTYVIGVREPTLAGDAEPPWEQDGERAWACRSPSSGDWVWDYDDPDTPRPAPDNLANLHTIAAAGGTDRALLIDTGDPEGTRAALKTAIDEIRREAVPCSVAIPVPPPGSGPFEPEKIDVRFGDEMDDDVLPFDPACAAGGWHYDDPHTPSAIELCPSTCRLAQSSLTLDFEVDFLCEPRRPVR